MAFSCPTKLEKSSRKHAELFDGDANSGHFIVYSGKRGQLHIQIETGQQAGRVTTQQRQCRVCPRCAPRPPRRLCALQCLCQQSGVSQCALSGGPDGSCSMDRMVNIYLILPRVEGGDGNACTRDVYTTKTTHGTNTHRHVLEAKRILTRERVGNYCMKIPKAISPICNCNKEAKREKAGL